jgi:hypothetical protein
MSLIIFNSEEEVRKTEAKQARDELENAWCNPDSPEDERVPHNKKFSGLKLDSYPRILPWTCTLCGSSGSDREKME